MKIFLKNIIFLLLFSCTFVACSDTDEESKPSTELPVEVKNLSAKWDITAPNSHFSSFEFSENKTYIAIGKKDLAKAKSKTTARDKTKASTRAVGTSRGLTKAASSDNTLYTGTYEIKSDGSIVLSGLGTITVTSMTEENFSFSIVLDSKPGEKIEIVSKKTEPISASDRTKLLCGTLWLEKEGRQWVIIQFSKAGTYLISSSYEDEEDEIATWKWKDASEKEIIYKRADGFTDSFRIIELTATKLVILDSGSDADEEETLIAVQAPPAMAPFKLKIEVRECNETWSPSNNAEYTPAVGADIKIYTCTYTEYDAVYTLLKEMTTDAKGEASFEYNGLEELHYTVTKGDKGPFILDYRILGLFNSQAEIDDYPQYNDPQIGKPKPGSLKFLDLNGDGVIGSSDKSMDNYLRVYSDEEDSLDEIVYLASATNLSKPTDIKALSEDLDTQFKYITFVQYILDHQLATKSGVFPTMTSIEQRSSEFWTKCYTFIEAINQAKADYVHKWSSSEKELWDNVNMGSKHMTQYAYTYTSLVSWYGWVPYMVSTDDSEAYINNAKGMAFDLERELLPNMSQKDQLVTKQLIARLHFNLGVHDQAIPFLDDIIASGMFALANDSTATSAFTTADNSEVMLGGIVMDALREIQKGTYMHPVRYTETILMAAEANFKLGNEVKALQYYNMFKRRNSQAEDNQIDESKIQRLFTDEMYAEGQWFVTNAVRWGTLSILKPEAMPHNNLARIPNKAFVHPSMVQNPGY